MSRESLARRRWFIIMGVRLIGVLCGHATPRDASTTPNKAPATPIRRTPMMMNQRRRASWRSDGE
jgi:hypothetical protein